MSIVDYVKHNMTFAELDATDKEKASYWLASLSMYGDPGDPLFAAIWLPVAAEARPRQLRLFAPNQVPLGLKAELDDSDWAPTLVGVTGSNSQQAFRCLVVLEQFQRPPSWRIEWSDGLNSQGEHVAPAGCRPHRDALGLMGTT